MKAIKPLLAIVSAGALLSSSQPSSAALFDFTTSDAGLTYTGGGSSLGQLIPDNTKAGVGYTINFGDSGVNIGSLSFTLNTSGGYNGDLYAYVSHGGTLVQLLNPNPAGSGLPVGPSVMLRPDPLTTGGGGVLTGSYVSYGNLSAFNGMSAAGDWTVFFADLSAGDTATLTGFNLNLQASAVPEPVNVALGIFGLGLAGAGGVRVCRRTRKAAPTLH